MKRLLCQNWCYVWRKKKLWKIGWVGDPDEGVGHCSKKMLQAIFRKLAKSLLYTLCMPSYCKLKAPWMRLNSYEVLVMECVRQFGKLRNLLDSRTKIWTYHLTWWTSPTKVNIRRAIISNFIIPLTGLSVREGICDTAMLGTIFT